MARDRLAGRKDFIQSHSYSPVSSPQPHYELARLHAARAPGSQDGISDDDFYIEISAIQDEINKLHSNIDAMSRLHAQQIDAVELAGSNISRQLETLTEETRSSSLTLKRRIQALTSQPVEARIARLRGPHIERVRSRFMEAIQRFQAEEKAYRDKTKDRLARQYRIVKPEASPEEVQAVIESGQDLQVFAQATAGGRFAQAQVTYNAVRDRHEEIKRIEVTLADLAQLFQDMNLIVEQQGDVIDTAHGKAMEAGKDIEAGQEYTFKARLSAINYRKGRWILFAIFVVIVIVVVVVVVTQVT